MVRCIIRLMPDPESVGRPKAIIVHPSEASAKAVIVHPYPKARVVGAVRYTPQEFCNWTRSFLGVDGKYGFYAEDIGKVVDSLGYHPSAYLWDNYHWMLLLAKGEHGFRIYDSTSGVKDVSFADRQKVHLIIGQEKRLIFTRYFEGWRELEERGYSLPEEPVSGLGRLLYTPADCAPLSIYAAGVALGRILT